MTDKVDLWLFSYGALRQREVQVDDYVRVEMVLKSGVTAFVYVNRAAV